MNYQLLDVEKEHRKYPRTYSIPRKQQRQNLTVGQYAKLVFLTGASRGGEIAAERMWVIVQEIGDLGYLGMLDHEPEHLVGLTKGDLIEFGQEHVAAIDLSQEGYEIPYDKYAVVNRHVWDGREWPGRLEHRPPPDEQFCGWWIYSGRESDTEREDWELFVPGSVAELIDKYPILDTVLDEPAGTEWVWDDEELEYRRG